MCDEYIRVYIYSWFMIVTINTNMIIVRFVYNETVMDLNDRWPLG